MKEDFCVHVIYIYISHVYIVVYMYVFVHVSGLFRYDIRTIRLQVIIKA